MQNSDGIYIKKIKTGDIHSPVFVFKSGDFIIF